MGTNPNDAPASQRARDFLTAIYGTERVGSIWTCGFATFPGNWTGAFGTDHLHHVPTDRGNFYFCIGELDPAATRRANDDVIRQHLIIADDVGTKAPRSQWDGLLALGFPEPSFRIETSPGNETWGWLLDKPVERDTDPDGWADVARIRAWFTAQGLTDPGVADPARYIRLPFGWNSKDKYVTATGEAPGVTLLGLDPSRRVTLDDLGAALHGGRADWRNVPLPPMAMNASALSRAGAVRRTADLNNPEPLMVLWQELGGGLRQVRQGVVEALCPNIADHTADGREGTGFAFLGDGLMQCSHGHCQHLSTPGFKQMMMDQFDTWADGRRAVGMDVPLNAIDAKHFLTLTDLRAKGALGADGIASATAEAEALAQRQAVAEANAQQDRDEKLAALAHRFVWVHPMSVFCDTKDRSLHTPSQLRAHRDVVPVIPVGSTGAKAAENILLNRPDRRDAIGVTYLPGDDTVLVQVQDQNGILGPHVNLWRPGSVGRRPGSPDKWLAALAHILPDQTYREWLLDWMAWVVQNPASRTPTIPIIVSGQGAGKDTVLAPFVAIHGAHNAELLTPERLMGAFNDWARKRLLVLTEVRLDANGKAYNKIKALTGAGSSVRVTINEKFRAPHDIEFMGVFIAMTNETDALRGIEHDDRRFAPYLSPADRLDTIWSARDYAELTNPAETERVHDFLLTRNLSQFNPFQTPVDTSGARAEILASSLPEPAAEAYNAVTTGEFKDRRIVAFNEVMLALQGHANPNVRNHLSHALVRRGLLAAGCMPCNGGKLVRVGGEETLRLWTGAKIDDGEKRRLGGKDTKAGIPAPKELADMLREDREAEVKRREALLLGASGVTANP